MPGPGEYRPDPTEGITRIEDLPKPKVRCPEPKLSPPALPALSAIVPTAIAGPAAPSTTSATRSPDGPATSS